jgi:bile acid:Na+ symporter, BASS family
VSQHQVVAQRRRIADHRPVRPFPVQAGGSRGRVVLIPLQWIGLSGSVTVFTVMLSLGLMLGRAQIAAALERRVVMAAVIFAVVVPIPALAVLVVKVLQPSPPVAAGIVLMAISPGAPIALRRALDAGGDPSFAPALHLAIVMLAVVTVPLSVLILDWVFSRDFAVTPFQIGRQVFFAQLLPLALGAVLRGLRPAFAERLQPTLVRAGNLLLLALMAMITADAPAIFGSVGWMPTAAGFSMTIVALAVGWAFAGRDARARPAAAVAAGMRNPGLALLIATLNRAPAAVIEGIIGYALGLALAIVVFLQWRKRAARD